MKQLVLAGAGHAHLGTLRRLRTQLPVNTQVTLLSKDERAVYSGMLPGWMAGHYTLDEICVDVVALCQQTGVQWVNSDVAAVDATTQTLTTTAGATLDYDLLSLNTGAAVNMSWQDEASRLANAVIPIRPLNAFVTHWQQILSAAASSDRYDLAVVGAGAAATELVMAAQVALRRVNPNHQAHLVCGEQLLSGFTSRLRDRVRLQLHRLDIKVIGHRATGYVDGQLSTKGASWTMDAVIAATGVTGAPWTQHTDLTATAQGFVAVNAQQQSVSHHAVYAVGDVATRVDQTVAHSGVHAVHGGAVLSDNLLASLSDQPLQDYQPKDRTLYLLSCGDRYAIGIWGDVVWQGRWVWYLKRRIDRHFIRQYQLL